MGSGDLLGIRNGVDGSTIDIHPNWSPDGNRIAFDGRPNIEGRCRCDPNDPEFGVPGLPPLPIGEPGMWIANATRPPNTLLLGASSAGVAGQPSFAPDGNRLAFVKNGRIWTMNAVPGSEGTGRARHSGSRKRPQLGPVSISTDPVNPAKVAIR